MSCKPSTTGDIPVRRCPSCSYPEHGSIACHLMTRVLPDPIMERYELRLSTSDPRLLAVSMGVAIWWCC